MNESSKGWGSKHMPLDTKELSSWMESSNEVNLSNLDALETLNSCLSEVMSRLHEVMSWKFLDSGMCPECKVPRVRSSASLLEDAKGEKCGSSLLRNFGEEEVDSNEND